MTTVFDTIKDRLPITEVLSNYITLIPAGTQFKAKCPFHNERSASFSVSPDRGLYYCFGCGARGDIFTFVEQFEGVDRKGALKVLAEKAGVELTKDHTKRESVDPLYELLEFTTLKYQSELKNNSEVLDYLTKRGVNKYTIDTFRIGYAPDNWHYVSNTIKSVQEGAIAERAGLVKKKEGASGNGYYDRFRKRIMFPLTDSSGRVVGFSGRLYPTDEESPKYLNSPETELFQKSRILFGFDKAKSAIRNHNFAILVEGQMDAVLAHQAGFKNTVATSGTAVSDISASDPTANLAVLARLTPNVFLAFDGDSAGQKALDRAAIVALSLSMNPKVVPLPEGIDPADYILANGAEAWKELLKKSNNFITHQVNLIQKIATSPFNLKNLIFTKIFPYLKNLSAIEAEKYITKIGTESGIGSLELYNDFIEFKKNINVNNKEIEKFYSENSNINPSIRFSALIEIYGSEIDKWKNYVLSYEFNGEKIQLPILGADKDRIIAQVEGEYKNNNLDLRNSMLDELVKNVINEFLNNLEFKYKLNLSEASRNNNEEEELKYSSLLTEIYQRRHGD